MSAPATRKRTQDIDEDNTVEEILSDVEYDDVFGTQLQEDSTPALSLSDDDDFLETDDIDDVENEEPPPAPSALLDINKPLTLEEQALDITELALTRIFGLHSFRGQQKDVILSALARHDQLVLMPTGGGKSLCYQLPAVLDVGVTVVVSPLISLMQDQLTALLGKGIPAAYISSQLHPESRQKLFQELGREQPTCKLLYATPEQLTHSQALQEVLSALHDRFREDDGIASETTRAEEHTRTQIAAAGLLARFVIDEAHCVSTWGQDFRKDYKELRRLKAMYPNAPTMALTATATSDVIRDIKRDLMMSRSCLTFKANFFRGNLFIRMCKKELDSDNVLVKYLQTMARSGSGIVYCISKRECERVSDILQKVGIASGHYHAAVRPAQRRKVQREWQAGSLQIMVATIAFGMGIDKPNVRCIVHYCMPSSVQGYFQEIGRAGRDGKPSECVLFHSGRDVSTLKFLARKGPGNKDRRINGVDQMSGVCMASTGCRHAQLLQIFGDELPEGKCNDMCDMCASAPHDILPGPPSAAGGAPPKKKPTASKGRKPKRGSKKKPRAPKGGKGGKKGT